MLAASQADVEINPSQGLRQIYRCQLDCRLGMPARAVKVGSAAYRVTGAALGGCQNQILLPQGGPPLNERLHLHVRDSHRDLLVQIAAAAQLQVLPFS